MGNHMPDELKTTLHDAVTRAEFSARLAKRLLMFPLSPALGADWNEHVKCLETTFTLEIMKALNDEVDRA